MPKNITIPKQSFTVSWLSNGNSYSKEYTDYTKASRACDYAKNNGADKVRLSINLPKPKHNTRQCEDDRCAHDMQKSTERISPTNQNYIGGIATLIKKTCSKCGISIYSDYEIS